MVAPVLGGVSRPPLGPELGALAQAAGTGSDVTRKIREALDVILGKGRAPGLENLLSLDGTPRLRGLTDRVRYALLARIGSNASEFVDPKQPPVVKQAVQLSRLGTSSAASRTATESVSWRDSLFRAPDRSGPRPDVDGFILKNARWLR